MTNQNNAAQAANENPLSDEYVNAVIQRHGYDSPESVIAQLHQWIGLHGGENTVTLLMYEAHKALSKLRAPVADERVPYPKREDVTPEMRASFERLFSEARKHNHGTLARNEQGAYRDLRVDADWVFYQRAWADALASAPVAGEALTWRVSWPGGRRPTDWRDFATNPPPSAEYLARAGYTIQIAYAAPQASTEVFDFAAHLARQAKFSARTFGPGARVAGVCDHIRKELIEVEASGGNLKEWVDVIILGLDGAWRSGATPQEIISAIVAKQAKNEARTWPDWRTVDPTKAIEHDRGGQP